MIGLRAVIAVLHEWQRKSELSCDRPVCSPARIRGDPLVKVFGDVGGALSGVADKVFSGNGP